MDHYEIQNKFNQCVDTASLHIHANYYNLDLHFFLSHRQQGRCIIRDRQSGLYESFIPIPKPMTYFKKLVRAINKHSQTPLSVLLSETLDLDTTIAIFHTINNLVTVQNDIFESVKEKLKQVEDLEYQQTADESELSKRGGY
ncbi:MAG: hypothetical protein HC945_02660 [Nitrosarchaeum sp.]|nr:hypothetical protein [Nitrosarchaeum sp.]